MEKIHSLEGKNDIKLDTRTRVTIRSVKPFVVTMGTFGQDGFSILGPSSDGDRYFQQDIPRDSTITIDSVGYYTVVEVPLPERVEYPDPESMCEVVEDHQLSMYERLKADMMQAISVYAESKGLDTFDEDDDLDFDEDDGLISTPYEYEALKSEFLQTLSTDADPNPESSVTTDPASEPNPSPDPVTVTPTLTEQPAS